MDVPAAPLWIGILGAARIAPLALVRPARRVEGVQVAGIAARDPARAAAFAARHGVLRAFPDYQSLVEAPGIDAVYVPLPNSLHAEWTLRALDAGKHVLCEKPLTAGEAEAAQVAERAKSTGRVVMEAFHYRYHPLAERMRALVHGTDGAPGRLGAVRRVEVSMCFPLPRFSDIRNRYELGGGATMDAGCYALHCLRWLGPGEPEVVAATALTLPGRPDVDRAMRAELRYPDGATGVMHASLWSGTVLRIQARVTGERGELTATNFALPQPFHRLTLTGGGTSRPPEGAGGGRTRRGRVPGEPSYTCQLRAFAAAVRGDAEANLTPPADSVRTMRLIDAVYRAAGLPPRGSGGPVR
jgi:predicted dehydrogenase